jgi:hypothetical protein
MKRAVEDLSRDWLLAAFDGQIMHFLPDISDTKRTGNKPVQRTPGWRRASKLAPTARRR